MSAPALKPKYDTVSVEVAMTKRKSKKEKLEKEREKMFQKSREVFSKVSTTCSILCGIRSSVNCPSLIYPNRCFCVILHRCQENDLHPLSFILKTRSLKTGNLHKRYKWKYLLHTKGST
jgi:hypothetical protein